MDKSVLVINTPKTCIECPFCEELDPQEWWGECYITKKNIYAYGNEEVKVPEWCPLKPLPKMVEVSDDAYISDYLDFDLGWNVCLKKITGGSE